LIEGQRKGSAGCCASKLARLEAASRARQAGRLAAPPRRPHDESAGQTWQAQRRRSASRKTGSSTGCMRPGRRELWRPSGGRAGERRPPARHLHSLQKQSAANSDSARSRDQLISRRRRQPRSEPARLRRRLINAPHAGPAGGANFDPAAPAGRARQARRKLIVLNKIIALPAPDWLERVANTKLPACFVTLAAAAASSGGAPLEWPGAQRQRQRRRRPVAASSTRLAHKDRLRIAGRRLALNSFAPCRHSAGGAK
jgi:hypothetical protein